MQNHVAGSPLQIPIILPVSGLRDDPKGVYLAVKVQARAGRNKIGAVAGGELKVKVASPPVNGAANQALVEFLAKTFWGAARCDADHPRAGVAA